MGLASILSLFSSDLAVDLGTATTLVYTRARGIVVFEPSIVAVNRVTNRVEAVGQSAKDMLGKTPGNIAAIRPMKDGVIADFEVTEKMLEYFIRKAHGRNLFVRPRIVISVPSEITPVEKRAVKDSALRAGASEVYLIEQAIGDLDPHLLRLGQEQVPVDEVLHRDRAEVDLVANLVELLAVHLLVALLGRAHLLHELRLRDAHVADAGGKACEAPGAAPARAPVHEDEEHEQEHDEPQDPLEVCELVTERLEHLAASIAPKGRGF